MITAVGVRSTGVYAREFARLSLQGPSSGDPYFARAIVGLDADEIVPKFYGNARETGTKFYNFVPKERELVMRIVLNPNFENGETYAGVRDELYRLISSARGGNVELYFYEGAGVKSAITGQITKFEVPHFSKTPEVQITITCKDPFFRGISTVELYNTDLGSGNFLNVYDSISTAPHGMTWTLTFTANFTANLYIRDAINEDWYFTVAYDAGRPIETGDVLTICSNPETKCVTLDKGGLGTTLDEMIDLVVTNSLWPNVFPGRNEYELNRDSKFDVEVTYTPAFWGV